MQRYDTYKDSGVKWLGEIPGHWEMRKMKFSFEERSQKGFPNLPLLAATQNHGVIRKTDYENRTVEATKSLDTLKLVEVGDFVISLRSFQGGIELCYEKGIISPAYTILRPTHITAGYFKHLGKSPIFIQLLKSMVTGIREGQNIDYGKLRENLLPIPPISEQTFIANYLDAATAKIDAAIAQQQKMIDLLNERKQIIINRAVTKGLNPNAKMKDSGVEWIGEVPEGWEVRKIKYILKESNIRSIDGHESSYSLSKSKGLIPFTDKDNLTQARINNVGAKVVKPGEIVFNRFKARLFAVSNVEAAVSPDYAIYQKIAECDLQYLVYLFSTKLYRGEFDRIAQGVGDGFSRLYTEDLFSIYAVFPNESEQKQIVGFIRKNTEKIDLAISQCENQISLLQERKQIIINEVVTGKVKVV